MAKDKKLVEEKMKERVRTSGKYHKAGLEAAENPLEKALEQLELMKQRLLAAFESGAVEAGMKEALESGKWEKRIPVAARRWEESSNYMVEEYMKKYNEIMDCVEWAKAQVKDLPRVTVEQRAEYAKQYQIKMHECMAKKKGLKTR